jgi:hypothetical protein
MKVISKPVELDYVEFSMYEPKMIEGKIMIATEFYKDGSSKKIICEKGFAHEFIKQCNRTINLRKSVNEKRS